MTCHACHTSRPRPHGRTPVSKTLAHSLNELRTHYTPSQLAMMAGRRANLKRGRTVYRPGTIAELSDGGPRSANQAATEVGIGRALVQEAKSVLRDATPELIQAVDAGKLTLHAAKNIVKAVPKDEQADAVSAVLEAKKGKPGARRANLPDPAREVGPGGTIARQ